MHLHSQDRLLPLQRSDKSRQQRGYARLRALCVFCRAARLAGRIDNAPADVRFKRVELFGYGVQLVSAMAMIAVSIRRLTYGISLEPKGA